MDGLIDICHVGEFECYLAEAEKIQAGNLYGKFDGLQSCYYWNLAVGYSDGEIVYYNEGWGESITVFQTSRMERDYFGIGDHVYLRVSSDGFISIRDYKASDIEELNALLDSDE